MARSPCIYRHGRRNRSAHWNITIPCRLVATLRRLEAPDELPTEDIEGELIRGPWRTSTPCALTEVSISEKMPCRCSRTWHGPRRAFPRTRSQRRLRTTAQRQVKLRAPAPPTTLSNVVLNSGHPGGKHGRMPDRVRHSERKTHTNHNGLMPLVPVVLLLREMMKPFSQTRNTTHRMQTMFPRPFDVGPVRDRT